MINNLVNKYKTPTNNQNMVIPFDNSFDENKKIDNGMVRKLSNLAKNEMKMLTIEHYTIVKKGDKLSATIIVVSYLIPLIAILLLIV